MQSPYPRALVLGWPAQFSFHFITTSCLCFLLLLLVVSHSLIPTCGQPKTMSAMPLSAEQSRRRALYSTPEQLKHTCQV